MSYVPKKLRLVILGSRVMSLGSILLVLFINLNILLSVVVLLKVILFLGDGEAGGLRAVADLCNKWAFDNIIEALRKI